MRIRRLLAVLMLLLSLPAAGAGPEAETTPDATVAQLHRALLAIMRDGQSLGFQGRLEKIEPEVEASFRFQSVARAVLGPHWNEIGDGERAQMQILLRRLTAVNYASRFSRLEDQRFVLNAVRPARGGRALVRSELRDAAERKASFDYVLEPGEDGWRIVNVIANGVSDLSLKRAEYASVIRNDGFQELLARIGQQITDLIEEAATSG